MNEYSSLSSIPALTVSDYWDKILNGYCEEIQTSLLDNFEGGKKRKEKEKTNSVSLLIDGKHDSSVAKGIIDLA